MDVTLVVTQDFIPRNKAIIGVVIAVTTKILEVLLLAYVVVSTLAAPITAGISSHQQEVTILLHDQSVRMIRSVP